MSGWSTCRIADLGRVVTGKTPPSSQPQLFHGTVPFITPSDMSFDGRYISTERFVSADWDNKKRSLLPEGAVCVVCIGATIGKVCMSSVPSQTNQQVNSIIVDKARFDEGFVFYALRTKADELMARAAGAATPIINKTTFSQVEITVPPLGVQRRIASILGAYDDLIRINRRRIAALEEMARGLFQEMVCESQANPHVDYPIGELVLDTLGGDWGVEEPDDDHTVSVRVVRGTDISKLQNGNFGTCPNRYIKQSSADKRLLKPYDVILENSINAKTRASGSTLIVTPGMIETLGGSVIAASFCRVFQFASAEHAVIFHMWCRHLHASGEIERYQVVAANGIANFQTTHFVRDCILTIRPPIYQEQAEYLVYLMSSVYAQQTANLAAARDLLLPRLISGQLSVADAERELEEAA